MKGFLENFQNAVYLGALGIYRRLTMERKMDNESFVPALVKSVSIFSFLNLKYNLKNSDGNSLLPDTEYRLFIMFECPLSDVIDQLPNELKEQVLQNTNLIGIEALFERSGKCKGILTEEGYDFLNQRALMAAKDNVNQAAEFAGQQIYEELKRTNYNTNRLFLEQKDNVYIPDSAIYRTDGQNTFIKAFPELFNMCYKENTKIKLYRCPNCGLILREYRPGEFSCVSERCRKLSNNFTKKIEFEYAPGTGKILNEIAAHNIYYPGQLELQIKDILDKAILSRKIKSYELWPELDTWDFRIIFYNGKTWVVDAKIVEKPHWIIDDMLAKIKQKINDDIIYVVPDYQDKVYLDMINYNHRYSGIIRCIRLSNFIKSFDEEAF